MNEELEKVTVGEIVATDFRTARVFERFGIDFCCGGRRSMVEACRAAAVDPDAVERALHELPAIGDDDDQDPRRWPVNRLVDHILVTHHMYVRTSIPVIAGYLAKLVEVHGQRHPELGRINAAFGELSEVLLQHMRKEEFVLFPYLRELGKATDNRSLPSPFGTVENPIRMMEREHQEAGDQMRLLQELTDGYTAPADGCATYRACFAELAQFQRDLHRHVHLENNVLFPRAVDIEHRSWRD